MSTKMVNGVWVKGTLPEGVEVQRCDVYLDERGWLIEWLDENKGGPLNIRSVYTSVAYPGQVRGAHYHLSRTEYWMVIGGEAEVALVDARPGSQGQQCTLCMGDVNPVRLTIPPGVAHQFRALGTREARLLCCATETYNPADNVPYDF
ncbi:MAG TPA: cupin domain-containing protein [Armatimonadetes bacterium]|nr:cupin domain-containing protein [Armatimonadota bacterium]